MKIMSWNVQGLSSPLTFQALRALVAHEKSSLTFLMETKNKEEVVKRLLHSLHFTNYLVVNRVGLAWGLVVTWNDVQKVEVVSFERDFMDLICTIEHTGNVLRTTFLYALVDLNARRILWEKVHCIRMSNNLP